MKDVDAWDVYWSTGALESCVANSDKLVKDALHTFWMDLVERSFHGSRFLDLASGNGAVLSILLGIDPELDVTGIDRSKLSDFAEAHKYKKVKFIANVDIEETPFISASFDRVTSQFGLEYALQKPISQENKAISEVGRLLSSGGECQFLMHHSSSELIRTNSAKLAELNALFAKGGLINGLLDFSDNDLSIEILEQRGQEYLDTELTKSKAISGQVFDAIAYFLQQRKTKTLIEQIHSTVARIEAEQSRLQQLVDSALSKNDMLKLQEVFSTFDIELTNCSEFSVSNSNGGADLLAWQVIGKKL